MIRLSRLVSTPSSPLTPLSRNTGATASWMTCPRAATCDSVCNGGSGRVFGHQVSLGLRRRALPLDPSAEPFQQRGQHLARGVVSEPKLGVEPKMSLSHEQFGRWQSPGMYVGQNLTQVVLGSGSADLTGRCAHHGYRLARERGPAWKPGG